MTKTLACTLQSLCTALPMIGDHHVQYSFDSCCILEELEAHPKKDLFAKLMQAQQQQHFILHKYYPFPGEGKSLPFHLQLFNFVVDCLIARASSAAYALR